MVFVSVAEVASTIDAETLDALYASDDVAFAASKIEAVIIPDCWLNASKSIRLISYP